VNLLCCMFREGSIFFRKSSNEPALVIDGGKGTQEDLICLIWR
jgi:hypothetical protein